MFFLFLAKAGNIRLVITVLMLKMENRTITPGVIVDSGNQVLKEPLI